MTKLSILILPFLLVACGTTVVTGDRSMDGAAPQQHPFGAASTTTGGDGGAEINGTCELVLPGRDPRTCEEISLFIRNPADGEERRAEFMGSKFKFTHLNKRSYQLNAVSSDYSLQTNVKNEVTPGQTLKIRILAKPRS